MNKKTILSGIQPSGNLCIGNYIGALKHWNKLQNDYESIFLVVDMHAITTNQVPSELRKRCLSFVAQYIACGINPEKNDIIIQSHNSHHAELMWVLSCFTYQGELSRMTQYKSKSRNLKNINTGLFTYPILMAADILLYQADLVPVGSDQKQHLELSRDIAQRFNKHFTHTFKIPEPFIPKNGSRIMSLQNPNNKMSKSDSNSNNIIALLDDPNLIRKKINRAVTDSGNELTFDKKNKPGLSNLITIYKALTSDSIDAIEKRFLGKMYSHFKSELADVIIETLSPIRDEYNMLIKDKDYLMKILAKGSDNGFRKSRNTLSKVYRKVGFLPKLK